MEVIQNKEFKPESPVRTIVMGLIVIGVFFGGLGSWAALAKIHGAVIAGGQVEVDLEKKVVQHLEGGIVKKIMVRNGDKVKKGQVLIELVGTDVNSMADLLGRQIDAQVAIGARAEAEKDFLPAIKWPQDISSRKNDPKVAELIDAEEKVFHSKRSMLLGHVNLLRTQIKQIDDQIKGFEDQIVSTNSIMDSLNEELKAKEELYKGRYIEKSRVMELKRSLSGYEGRKAQMDSNVAESRERIAEIKLKIADLYNNYKTTAAEELTQAQNQLFTLAERVRPYQDAQQRLEIKAPISGVVLNLQVHSVDGVVTPRQPLMDIVPEDSQLIVAAKIMVQDITKVHVGQACDVQLSAFDRRTTPLIPGKVTYVSADAMDSKNAYQQYEYYLVHVTVDPEILKENDLYLSPGMPVAVYIKVKSRSVLDYLLEPLTENFRNTFRET